ncbi:MAG: putative sugar O-methyltransferase [Lachnospiraceae bacterium]|nr:putative sugar O-methyltransferase [Lachnospiraceae bacterium]
MKICSKEFTNRQKGDFEKLCMDSSLMKKIITDMQKYAGSLSPLNHWHLVEKEEGIIDTDMPDEKIVSAYDSTFEEQYASAQTMLDAWIGSVGLQDISLEEKEGYNQFNTCLDYAGLYSDMIKNTFGDKDYKNRDLGTVAEIEMIAASLKSRDQETYILEVGGGYGRVAEGLCNCIEKIKYVMVDAVPGSILYSYEYLKTELPDKKIGFWYLGDEFDLEKYDIYIIPAWHFEKENKVKYDCCINISSLQEMGQQHVDYYLDLFDRITNINGIIYIQNSRDYVFKGNWNFPDTWKRLIMFNTPISWTEYFPTEIFEKTSVNQKNWNCVVQAGYEYQLYEKRCLNQLIDKKDQELNRLNHKFCGITDFEHSSSC